MLASLASLPSHEQRQGPLPSHADADSDINTKSKSKKRQRRKSPSASADGSNGGDNGNDRDSSGSGNGNSGKVDRNTGPVELSMRESRLQESQDVGSATKREEAPDVGTTAKVGSF